MTTGGAAAVSVKGNATFEPAYEHEVVYGDVPDVGDKMTLEEGQMAIEEFLHTIYMATGWNILMSDAVKGTQLKFWLSDKTPKEALEVLKFHNIYYEFSPQTKYLYVMTQEEWLQREFGAKHPHEFIVRHADISYIESILSSLMSAEGRMITDQRTQHIFVWDTRDNLDLMKKTFSQLDVPLEKTEFKVAHVNMAAIEGVLTSMLSPNGRLLTDERTGQIFAWDTPAILEEMDAAVEELDVPMQKIEFMIDHADLGDIESVLQSMLSPSGSILSDPRTGQMFVWDLPTHLDKMRTAVARLDVPVETRTFEITYINAEDMIDSVEALISERGLVQVDPRYNALVVTDLPSRLERIGEIVATLDKELETRTWVIKYADMDFLADQIELQIPAEMGEIVLNEDVHQITATGLPSRLDKIGELIAMWDVKRDQVLIEAFIVEVGSDIEREFNINWSYFDSSGNAPIALHSGSGFTETATPSGDGESMSIGQLPYTVPAYGNLQLDDNGNVTRPVLTNIAGEEVIKKLAGNNLAVTLDYLDRKNKATILSSPRVVVQDGEEATFENATRVPYVSASTYFNNYGSSSSYSNVNNTNRVEFIDVGTILNVLPRITEDQNILLDISAEDSTFVDKRIIANNQTSTVPEKTVRRADTQLRVQSGETIVLGGLRRDRTSKETTKTPFLGDLPLVGRLFRNPSNSSENNTLMIFITITIVDEFTAPEAVELAKAEEGIAEALRHSKKDFWGRLEDRLSNGENTFSVSIGQKGHIHSEGKRVELDELKKTFSELTGKSGLTLVIRKHPRAPQEVVSQVTEAALMADLKIEYDKDLIPLVPSYHDREAQQGGAGTEKQADAS